MGEGSREDRQNSIKQGETHHELPGTATAQQLATLLSALANARGGTVAITQSTPQEVSEAQEKVAEACLLCEPALPRLSTQVLDSDERHALSVVVPAGLPDVYSVAGRYWIRQGKRNRVLSGKLLQHLILERTGTAGATVSFEARPVPNATLDDLDWEKVRDYLRIVRYGTGKEFEALSRGDLTQALMRLGGLVRESGAYLPNHAAILIFGSEPHQFLPGNQVTLVRYAGNQMGDEYLRNDLRGTLPEQVKAAEAFLINNMRKGSRLTGWQREEQTEYPLDAIREAVVNAVAHRDYSIQGEGIRVIMFADRLEVYSPGRLPGHVTLANLTRERFSRNPIIVQALVDLGFIESLGYGINRMIQLMEDAGLSPPSFEETANGFKVTLQSQGDQLVSNGADPSRWIHLNLNERQQKALVFLTEQDRLTNRVYQDLCPDVSPETIRRDLAELVRRGLLLKIGDKKSTYYIFK